MWANDWLEFLPGNMTLTEYQITFYMTVYSAHTYTQADPRLPQHIAYIYEILPSTTSSFSAMPQHMRQLQLQIVFFMYTVFVKRYAHITITTFCGPLGKGGQKFTPSQRGGGTSALAPWTSLLANFLGTSYIYMCFYFDKDCIHDWNHCKRI